jgi:hypothetical protein
MALPTTLEVTATRAAKREAVVDGAVVLQAVAVVVQTVVTRRGSPFAVVEGIRATAVPVCDDGLDNDQDGLADYLLFGGGDSGCSHPADVSEEPQCADGFDNDGDGLTDYREREEELDERDPQCLSRADDSEFSP